MSLGMDNLEFLQLQNEVTTRLQGIAMESLTDKSNMILQTKGFMAIWGSLHSPVFRERSPDGSASSSLACPSKVFLHQRHKGEFREGDFVAFMAVLRNGKLQAKDPFRFHRLQQSFVPPARTSSKHPQVVTEV